MKLGWTISAVVHGGVLLGSLIALVFTAPPPPRREQVVYFDNISVTDFSQMANGTRTAPTADAKPLVEKVADPKPAEDNPANKIVDKPEIVAAADQPQPPKPEPEKKAPDPKPPTPQPQPQKSEPKQAFAKEPEPKIDPIAEALKKEARKPDPKTQKKTDTPAQKKAEPQKPQPTFDRTKIAALLDKRDPQRRAITGSTLSNTQSTGTATGADVPLSQDELGALVARLRDCWSVPAGVVNARDLSVVVLIQLRQDGSLAAEPRVLNRGSHPAFQAASESALRAVRTCAPFTFLRVATYSRWKELEVNFDPIEMFRG